MFNHKIKTMGVLLALGFHLIGTSHARAANTANSNVQEAVSRIIIVDKNHAGGSGCSDAWAGTLVQPLCSISKGLSLLQPGDTLFIRQGTYPSFSVSRSGLAGKYITISGYGGEMPLVQGGAGIELRGVSYVWIRGFEVSGASGNFTGGISLTNAGTVNPNYNIIEGNRVHGNTQPGMSGIKISEGSHNKILNNEVYDNYFTGIRISGVSASITGNEIGYNHVYNHTLAGGDSDGIGLNGVTVTRTYIHDNLVHDNSDDGIDTWNSRNNIIAGNVSYHHTGIGDGNGFKLGGVDGGGNLVRNNIAYDNKARGFDSNGSGANVYYQNVAYNNTGFGFQDNWRRDAGCDTSLCPGVFIDNIGYNNGKGNFSAGTSTAVSHNNIWYSDSGSAKAAYDATLYSSLSALYAASGNRLDDPDAGDLSSLQVDPQFSDPAGRHFDLLDSSPAIDHGDPANPGHVPAFGRVDIGAFEFGLNKVFVTGISRSGADPTNTASVNFTVTFSVPVSGVDGTDFALVTAGITNAKIKKVSGSGTTYTVTALTGTGSGSLHLNLIDNDSILDGSLSPLGGAGYENGDFTAGETFSIDKTKPGVTSIIPADASPTGAGSVNFTVTFSEPVTGVDAKDFKLVSNNAQLKPAITNVSGSGETYTVTAGTGTNTRLSTLRLDLTANHSIRDAAFNILTTGYKTGSPYTVDKPPVVISILRAGVNPTSAAAVKFTVKFSEAVTGLDADDFNISPELMPAGASILSVTGKGANWTVTVSTGTGSGLLRLDLIDNDTIKDATGNSLGGPGPVNGDFISGQTYTVRPV